MPCTGCGKPFEAGFAFCPFCGRKAEPACAACGAPLPGDFAFCPRCGRPRGESAALAPPAPPADVSRGERRVVTVVFADLSGFTRLSERLDPELLSSIVNHLFAEVGRIVHRFEGRIDKYIGDAAMILFGAPVAHEDDPERAVLTARELLGALPRLRREIASTWGVAEPIDLHVGIATGLVVAGRVGTDAASGYTVMGDAVNVASRLLDLAPAGKIYLSESTRRLVRGRVRTEPVGSMKVRGKEESVAVHEVVGVDPVGVDPRGLSGFAAPLVGRDREAELLATLLANWRRGDGALLAVAGAAGVGKSRLVRESLAAAPAGDGAAVHSGRCISYGRSVPFYPWGQIVASLLRDGVVRPADREMATILDEIATGDFGSRPVDGAQAWQALAFRAVRGLVERALDRGPLLLVFEDMHWCDPSSLELLETCLPLLTSAPLVLEILHRPGLDVDAWRDRLPTGPEGRFWRLGLEPLGPELTRRLVDALTGEIRGFPDDLRDAIVRRSEGIPLFAEELVRIYLDEGLIRTDGDHWTFDAAAAGQLGRELPTTLHQLLAARIDRFAPEDRARLEAASVLGKAFDPAFVERMLGIPPDDGAWTRLLASSEIVAAEGTSGTRLRFAHALTAETVYATLLRTRRTTLHLAVARELEKDESRRDGLLHSLAWHFEQGGAPDRAAGYWAAAARQAIGLHANAEALAAFDAAIGCEADEAAADALRVEKGQLLVRIGRAPVAAPLFEEVAGRARGRNDDDRVAETLAWRAYAAYLLGDGPGIGAWAERALDAARSSALPERIAFALRQVGIGHEFAGRFAPAEAAYRELLDVEERAGQRLLRARVYNSLGEMARASDRFAEAISWYGKFEEETRRQSGDVANPIAWSNTAGALIGLGECERALGLLDRALAERERTGHLAHASEILVLRALARLGTGDPAGGADDARRGWTLANEHGEAEIAALALRALARVGRSGAPIEIDGVVPADPESLLRESVRRFGAMGKRGEEARSRWELARELARRGDPAGAADELGRAEAIFREIGFDIPADAVARERSSGAP